MRLYDAHNHLQDDRFAGLREDLLATAVGQGVVKMVVNGACEEDWPLVQELAAKFPQVLPSFGYHPWYLHERTPAWRSIMLDYVNRASVGVGEIGLDRWKPGLSYEGQEEAFTWQLRLAAERDLPVSIHCLQIWGRMHELLREHPRPSRGFLLHSYGGSGEMVEPLRKLGAYFSFPGYFMHERKNRRREAFAKVPLDRLLIETDAPDQLPPESRNAFPLHDASGNAMNHPANVAAIYQYVAEQREMPLLELEGQIEANFQRLFGC